MKSWAVCGAPVTEIVVDSLKHRACFVEVNVGLEIKAFVSVLDVLRHPLLLVT